MRLSKENTRMNRPHEEFINEYRIVHQIRDLKDMCEERRDDRFTMAQQLYHNTELNANLFRFDYCHLTIAQPSL